MLVDYLQDHRDRLSADSLDRLERNPLRILDSKDAGDRQLIADAPLYGDHLTDRARTFFATVTSGLDAIGIGYRVNSRLVRGLDYYCHTAFEFVAEELGAQSTVMAGGRYDGLVEQMGGPAAPGIGWAAGIERLALLADDPSPAPRPIAVVPVGAAAELPALQIAHRLRAAGYAVDLGFSGGLAKRLKRADKVQARVAVILGEDEIGRGAATLRDLDTGEQQEVPLAQLDERLARWR